MNRRRVTIFLTMPFLVFLMATFVEPLPVYAQTQEQATKCKRDWDKIQFTKKDDKYDKYQASGCGDKLKGNCVAASAEKTGPYLEVNCSNTPESNGKDASGSSVTSSAGVLSTSCRSKNDVCIGSLPRTKADGNFVQGLLQLVIGVIAAISVLFVAIGGLRYVMSQGDPQAVGKAKSTIVYALIGLAIALLAQGIITLVVKGVTS